MNWNFDEKSHFWLCIIAGFPGLCSCCPITSTTASSISSLSASRSSAHNTAGNVSTAASSDPRTSSVAELRRKAQEHSAALFQSLQAAAAAGFPFPAFNLPPLSLHTALSTSRKAMLSDFSMQPGSTVSDVKWVTFRNLPGKPNILREKSRKIYNNSDSDVVFAIFQIIPHPGSNNNNNEMSPNANNLSNSHSSMVNGDQLAASPHAAEQKEWRNERIADGSNLTEWMWSRMTAWTLHLPYCRSLKPYVVVVNWRSFTHQLLPNYTQYTPLVIMKKKCKCFLTGPHAR